jgi:hypothetical protein
MNGLFKRFNFAAQIKPDVIAEAVAVVLFDGGNFGYRGIRRSRKFGIVLFRNVERHELSV